MPKADERDHHLITRNFGIAARLLPHLDGCKRNPLNWRPETNHTTSYYDAMRDALNGEDKNQWVSVHTKLAYCIDRDLHTIGLPELSNLTLGASVPENLARWFPSTDDVIALILLAINANLHQIEQETLISQPNYRPIHDMPFKEGSVAKLGAMRIQGYR